jgi:hypothetical protein
MLKGVTGMKPRQVFALAAAAAARWSLWTASDAGAARSKVPDDRQSSSVVQASSDTGNATVLPAS